MAYLARVFIAAARVKVGLKRGETRSSSTLFEELVYTGDIGRVSCYVAYLNIAQEVRINRAAFLQVMLDFDNANRH